ncbi:patatin-like phospholipase family protein [Laspinema sp. A4]|uniref:patatin-like phospholipase family protein n=1 Tax=Laspinema sp. D2d TaxID=2953686 RepID=UPI0021BB6013|nr:patatin-like phospholipase family protein [Laspinema sp. D2d]MCT7986734.1 patatin-like phospholipase family protein [Laspinema sp. D2d]
MTTILQDMEKKPEDLSKISFGLALSGGGYRAAAFHLGTLAYLDKIQLLPQLRRLSTVSGGTFTGMKYILSLVEGVPFSQFFRNFYLFLRDENLFQQGLADLNNGSIRVPSGQRKLILSMANVYADTLLKSPKGSPYTLKAILDSKISVEEISFNTTEFCTGVAFRFQKSISVHAYIGNGNISIPRELAQDIRLADILAASSCFPGGFEPMQFPQDFAWPNNKIPSAIKDNKQFESLGLMDGGISDNQGIDSLLLADKRKGTEPLGLLIISDVDSEKDNLLLYPQNNQISSNLTLGQIDGLIRFFLVTCGLTIISVVYELWQEIQGGTFIFLQDFFSALMPIILVAGIVFVFAWGREVIKNQILSRIPNVGLAGWKDLKTLTVDELFYLLELRVKSLLALTSSVFMVRIKRLVTNCLHGDKAYQNKIVSNKIDRLIDPKRNVDLPKITPLSQELKEVIENAAKMPTTLWFKKSQSLIDITIAGQATICFNLMQYIVRQYGKESETYPPAIKQLWDELKQDWEILNDNPISLLEELLPEEKFVKP